MNICLFICLVVSSPRARSVCTLALCPILTSCSTITWLVPLLPQLSWPLPREALRNTRCWEGFKMKVIPEWFTSLCKPPPIRGTPLNLCAQTWEGISDSKESIRRILNPDHRTVCFHLHCRDTLLHHCKGASHWLQLLLIFDYVHRAGCKLWQLISFHCGMWSRLGLSP